MTEDSRRGRPRGPEKAAFALRLDPKLLASVRRCAAAELRSVNAQIETLLKDALARRGVPLHPAPDSHLDEEAE
ncbi:hypothetical protein [Acetobacter orleanensis]|uniref:Arc-like DNA binding domain-containing protein n=1 Tax=Acetobacter orleanensis TaxID=104099 RepID=A0A4Y3TIB9_9PROT|nr:hypothetical protein [Acetobacter orleanensis]KXV62029.1 hypothetical protein AD949_12260 [Acetobacter orleanensis]PCD80363.1 hypothetical protein CO710_00965 [Acetobacter orleanensis]GAN68880.1 hypothetical protein Abol_024_019 [Acetobacter orleanensis JCM 7639]GBR30865.1 hypothetical protein AA0473_2383 [Acetobacter orleanensis NRIC 0473]GEB81712.1 hypothetical protein AOR01nite_01890 [Acetobacter orleanensis]